MRETCTMIHLAAGGILRARLMPLVTAMGLLVALPTRAQSERFVRTLPAPTQSVVTDAATGRMWQGCVAGLSGSNCTGNVTNMTWQAALAYCENLDWGGRTDWYLPNIKEIRSIGDSREVLPAIDRVAFPNTPGSFSWSSSSRVDDPSRAWAVNFGSPSIDALGKAGSTVARCVRLDL